MLQAELEREIGEMQLSLSYQKSFDEILTSQ